jgi:hypothetical protein
MLDGEIHSRMDDGTDEAALITVRSPSFLNCSLDPSWKVSYH